MKLTIDKNKEKQSKTVCVCVFALYSFLSRLGRASLDYQGGSTATGMSWTSSPHSVCTRAQVFYLEREDISWCQHVASHTHSTYTHTTSSQRGQRVAIPTLSVADSHHASCFIDQCIEFDAYIGTSRTAHTMLPSLCSYILMPHTHSHSQSHSHNTTTHNTHYYVSFLYIVSKDSPLRALFID
jgi:hypothetical protein